METRVRFASSWVCGRGSEREPFSTLLCLILCKWFILLMNVGLTGIIYRAEKRFLLIEPDGFLMIVGDGMGVWVLFQVGG